MESVEQKDEARKRQTQKCLDQMKTIDRTTTVNKEETPRPHGPDGGNGGPGCSSEPLSVWPQSWEDPPRAIPSPLVKCARVMVAPKDRPFRCSDCGKAFRFNSALKKHELVHSGEKPHKCCECGKGFQFVSDLRKHVLIHSGERPYRCLICGKGFVDVSNFRRHERIHTGDKPFSCPFCDKDFTDKGNVKKHMRVHTGEKPFSCAVCRKDFSFLASYKRHMRIHRAATESTVQK